MRKATLFQVTVLTMALLFVPFQGLAQNITVRGTVNDESGSPLIGVSVYVDGTSIGTATGQDGSYQLSVAPTAELTYFYVGYDEQVISVASRTTINVTLKSSATALDDVVVIGYGVTTKRDLTGSVAQVRAEDLMANSPTSIAQALQGKAAGVMVTGEGRNPQIRIRGNRSIRASNDPLFVVDGIPQSGGMDLINPNDVESVEILKDASATAIYGSRGANGVILVTTKQGERGRVTVSYEGYLNMSELNQWERLMNAAEYLEYNREAERTYTYDKQGGYTIASNSSYPTEVPNMDADLKLSILGDPYSEQSLRPAWASGTYDPSKLRDFNWQTSNWNKQWYSHSHNLSIRGGSQNTIVAVSGNFMDTNSQTKGTNNKRYMLNMNIEQNIRSNISVGARASFTYMESTNGVGISGVFSPLRNPYNSPTGADGNPDYTQAGDPAYGIVIQPDPLSYNSFLNFEGNRNRNRSNRISTSIYSRIGLLPGLTYYISYGTNLRLAQNGTFNSSLSTAAGLGDSQASLNTNYNRDWTFTQTLTYAKKFGDHDFSIMAAQDAYKGVYEQLNGSATGLPLDSQLWYNLQDAYGGRSVTTGYNQTTLLSWFGRAHYGYKGKYLLDFTYRMDGASVLAPGHKWSGFPSAAFAWRISDEPFMSNQTLFSNLKLRAGYGQSGQQSVPAYSTVPTMTNRRYTWGTTGAMGYVPNSLANPNLGWETSTTLSLGLDFAVLRGRLSGVLDLYSVKTTDLLLNRRIPVVTGFSSILQNVGSTANRGIELTLNSINIQKQRFNWTTDFNISYNKEEIVELNYGKSDDVDNRWFIGKPIHTYYDVTGDGRLWNYSAADFAEMDQFNANGHGFVPGSYRYTDQNGDYRINANDRVIIGSKMPKWSASLTNTFRYSFNNGSALDLYVFMYGYADFTVFRHLDPGGAMGRYNSVLVDYWTPRNTDAIHWKPTLSKDISTETYRNATSYWKGDFIKISDITLGYSLPQSLLRKVGLSRVRLYAKATNPFAPITKFPSEFNDPEGAINLPSSGNFYSSAHGDGNTTRTFQFGIQLSF